MSGASSAARVKHSRASSKRPDSASRLPSKSCAEASESRLRSRRCGPAKTADRLVTMAHGVDQGAGAEPCLGEDGIDFGGTIVGHQGRTAIAYFFQGQP